MGSLYEKELLEEERGKSAVETFDPLLDLTMGMTDDEMTERFQAAVYLSILEKKIKGVPVPGWDSEKRRAYLEFPSGDREYSEGSEKENP